MAPPFIGCPLGTAGALPYRAELQPSEAGGYVLRLLHLDAESHIHRATAGAKIAGGTERVLSERSMHVFVGPPHRSHECVAAPVEQPGEVHLRPGDRGIAPVDHASDAPRLGIDEEVFGGEIVVSEH